MLGQSVDAHSPALPPMLVGEVHLCAYSTSGFRNFSKTNELQTSCSSVRFSAGLCSYYKNDTLVLFASRLPLSPLSLASSILSLIFRCDSFSSIAFSSFHPTLLSRPLLLRVTHAFRFLSSSLLASLLVAILWLLRVLKLSLLLLSFCPCCRSLLAFRSSLARSRLWLARIAGPASLHSAPLLGRDCHGTPQTRVDLGLRRRSRSCCRDH